MNVLETEWWTLMVPAEWWAEQDQDSVLVGDRDNVGCIEFSTLHKHEGEFDPGEVEQLARLESEQNLQWKSVSLGDFSGFAASYREEGDAIREWYVADGALLLFITYSCGEENAGMDDAAVDEFLDTLIRVGKD